MKLATRHPWRLTPKRATALQERLRARVVSSEAPRWKDVRTVAGLDVCYWKATDRCHAAVVVTRVDTMEVIEEATASMASPFPYVPGLLSFREASPLIAALRRLRCEPDVLLFDAQGRAHPRRLGLASHLGVLYDRPSVGCAKSRLCGVHKPVGEERGAWTPLRDEATGEVIGSVVRTRAGVKPVYVSVGHRVTDAFARRLVLALSPRYRLTEPIRLAHRLSNATRRELE